MSDKTIKETLKECSLVLNSPKEASILLGHILGYNQVELILNENELFTKQKELQKLIDRRLSDEPIEYITNSVSFYSEEFFIKEGALIPRPETEILIDLALDILKDIESPKVAEIGTGSGIIPIILAKNIENIKITATDISKDALKIAKKNTKKFDLCDKIEFMHKNLLDDIYDEFDMIISNPPYIADDYKLDKNISYEPDSALFGGAKGDEILKEIIDIYRDRECRYLLCEMGYDQKESISSYLTGFDVKFYKDLAGFDRGFVVRK